MPVSLGPPLNRGRLLGETGTGHGIDSREQIGLRLPRFIAVIERRQRDPNKIRHLCHGDSAVVRPNGDHHPVDRGSDDHDFHGGERQVPHSKLNRREDQVRQQVDSKGLRHEPRQLASKCLPEHEAKADENEGIEYLPD